MLHSKAFWNFLHKPGDSLESYFAGGRPMNWRGFYDGTDRNNHGKLCLEQNASDYFSLCFHVNVYRVLWFNELEGHIAKDRFIMRSKFTEPDIYKLWLQKDVTAWG